MTQRAFFTYVWGAPGDPAWPLTFADKGSRTRALRDLAEGDLVYTVCTKREPTPPELRGRVVGVYVVSKTEVNTADYDLGSKHEDAAFDSTTRFPFALHPISVWAITDTGNLFASRVGPLPPADHLQAQSYVVPLGDLAAESLAGLKRVEIEPALPKTQLGLGKVVQANTKLAPKHEGSFIGQFRDHELWYVYTLVLEDRSRNPLAVKVGYSHDPAKRKAQYNFPLVPDVTGLRWDLPFQQAAGSEANARLIEQAVLAKFDTSRSLHNGEVLVNVDPRAVFSAIAVMMRSHSAQVAVK